MKWIIIMSHTSLPLSPTYPHLQSPNLLARGNELAFILGVRVPSTRQALPPTLMQSMFAYSLLQLRSEVADETLDRPGESLAKSADGVALDLLRELLEHVDLALARIALFQTLHDLVGPLAALSAGGALAAGLVLVKGRQAGDGTDDVCRLVHDDDGGGTKTGLGVLEGVEVHELVVAHALGDDGGGGTTGDDGQKVVPATTDTTAVAIDQLTERDGHLLLDGARVVDVARDTEQLGSLVSLTAESGKPLSTTTADGWGNGNGLDVCDGARASEETDGGGEWRLQTRLSGLALERLDQRGFFTANIRTHPTVEVNIKVVTRPAGILANQASLVGLVDRVLENGSLVVEFTTDVDVGGRGVHGAARNEAALDELVRVLAHNLTILACSRLTLIGVDNEVSWFGVLIPVLEVHERLEEVRPYVSPANCFGTASSSRTKEHTYPFQTRGETSTTSTPQSRSLNLRDNLQHTQHPSAHYIDHSPNPMAYSHPIMSLQDNLLGLMPIARLHRILQARTMPSVQVLEYPVRILQTAIVARRMRRSGVLDSSIFPLLLCRSGLLCGLLLLLLFLLGPRLCRRGREPGC